MRHVAGKGLQRTWEVKVIVTGARVGIFYYGKKMKLVKTLSLSVLPYWLSYIVVTVSHAGSLSGSRADLLSVASWQTSDKDGGEISHVCHRSDGVISSNLAQSDVVEKICQLGFVQMWVLHYFSLTYFEEFGKSLCSGSTILLLSEHSDSCHLGNPTKSLWLQKERTYRLTEIFRADRIVIVAFPPWLDITLFPPWLAPFFRSCCFLLAAWEERNRCLTVWDPRRRSRGGADALPSFQWEEQMPVREILTGAD